MKKKIAILGSTGSIGKSTLEVIKKDKKNFDVIFLSANNNYKKLIQQAKEFKVKNILIRNKLFYERTKKSLKNSRTKVYSGNTSIKKISSEIFIINKDSSYDYCLSFCKKNYKKNEIITGVNQYAQRGGIIDIYPETSSNPKRLSFLKDLTEIRSFDIETQISTEKRIDRLTILINSKKTSEFFTIMDIDINSWNKVSINNEFRLIIHRDINNKKTNPEINGWGLNFISWQ